MKHISDRIARILSVITPAIASPIAGDGVGKGFGILRAAPADGDPPPVGDGSGDPAAGATGAPAPPPPAPTAAPSPPPRNPWLPPADAPPRRSAGLDDIFRPRGKTGATAPPRPTGFTAWTGQMLHLPPRADGKSWLPLALGAVALLWLVVTSSHQLGSTEQGVVTTFGKYSHLIGPGVSFTAPWPIQDVAVTDVTSIQRDSIPEGDGEKLMLTSDQNLVDLSYLVRWNIKNLKLYSFQLDDPDATVKEVAEAAMRAAVAEVPLNDVMGGAGRAEIEQDVRQRMQAILDAYRSGVAIQGVDIKKADPPAQVNEAFQKVQVAQQEANRDLYNAQAFAQTVVAKAQGDTAQFDTLYAQYKAAPEVTRRRMYYETMEHVLANNDKVISGSNTTSYLPLPQLRPRTPDAAATAGAAQ